MHGSSYSGAGYGMYGDSYEESPLEKVKQQFWTAKQTIISKFGKKEDDALVASDAELDSKLAVFGSIKYTCESLLKCIEHYQDYICDLSQEENALGRFLKSRGKSDKTQAGKMMAAVGRAQSYTAQQRLALRIPLVRLYQDLEVFTKRAVLDCNETVEATEKARTEYRGTLLRMKDCSTQLDPDTYKHMEKFRHIQAQVRKTKSKFDKLKLDCLQKIDLLAASRCNLFSQLLANYQNCLMRFWDKTAKVHSTISETFKGYQHYEFTVLKDLTQPSIELAQITAGEATQQGEENSKQEEQLIALTDDARADSLENLFKDSPIDEKLGEQADSIFEPRAEDNGLMNALSGDLGTLRNLEAGRSSRRPGPAGDGATGNASAPADESYSASSQFIDDLLATIGDEGTDNSFAKQWQQSFGSAAGSAVTQTTAACASPALSRESTFQPMMPSQLLDFQKQTWFTPANRDSGTTAERPGARDRNDKKSSQKEAWFNLFADIDPLQNPDSLGKTLSETDRGC